MIELIHFASDALIILIIPGIVWLIRAVTMLQTDVKWIMLSIDGMGRRAAKILHRDDDKWEMDYILEKYYEHSHELSFEEWNKLSDRMQKIVDDSKESRDYRLAAAMLLMICDHKLMKPPRKINII